MKKLIIAILIWSLVCISVHGETLASNSKSTYLIEYSSETVLYANNEEEKLFPASMTKMMSLYLIFDAINTGKLHLDDMITVSEHAAGMGGSQIWLQVNEQMSVDDLLKAVCVASANDAVVALAEKVSGSEELFVNEMNRKVKEWNLTGTNFVNASGLHDDNHYTTAKDMAVIAKKLIEVGGDLLFSYTTLYDSYVREGTEASVWLVNTNKLLRSLDGTDGLKTGYTSQAGYCITVTTLRNGVRLIGVVMKEPTNKIRDKEIKELIEYGFSMIQSQLVFKANDFYETKHVEDGKPDQLQVIIGNDVSLHYINNPNYTTEVTYTVTSAPIEQGSVIGKIKVVGAEGIQTEADLLAGNSIEKLDYWDYVLKLLKMILY